MNDQEREEFERLKRGLASLRHELDRLSMQTQQLEARLDRSRATTAPTPSDTLPVQVTPPAPPSSGEPAAAARSTPPPIPPVLQRPSALKPVRETGTGAVPPVVGPEYAGATSPPGPPPLHSEVAPTPARQSSFELKLGTVWLVRIGIVMLLTALVFFGNYAYQRVIIKLGPPGKLMLMYLGSGVLLGLGAWLERRQKSLKNYAQVLFAGGLAAVYFTTYAAHHIQALRVIADARIDGLLLLAWAGVMSWFADHKKSELLALFAICLAYYTSIITNIELFTLYSTLVLTAAGVLFFVRNRWVTLSFTSLLATYGGYAYWRFYVHGHWLWHLNLSTADFLLGNLFLLGYWLLFTAAVFLSRHEKFAGEPRAAFLTINNGAFFGLVVFARFFIHAGSFWKLAFCFGAVLLGLAALAVRRLAGEKIVVNSYLTQGLVLVTLGFMTYFTGLRLAIVLAAESFILLILADQRQQLILKVAAHLIAALAVGWASIGMEEFDRTDLSLGAAVGVLMAFNAFWSRRNDPAPRMAGFRPQAAYFSALALLTWLVTTWNNSARANLPLTLAVEAVLLTASFYVLRVREIALLGQGYLVLAQACWLWQAIDLHAAASGWKPAFIITATLGLSHWWQRQQALEFVRHGRQLLQGFYALAIVGLLFFWLKPRFDMPGWLAFTSLLAVTLTVYGVFTRAWFVAAGGQIFLAISASEFARQLVGGHPDPFLALAPMAGMTLLAFSTSHWFKLHPEARTELREPLLGTALIYRWIALVMSLAWVHEYIPARERIWVFALLGLATFCWAGWRRNQEGILSSAVLTMAGLFAFWFPWGRVPTVYVPNLFAILLLLGQQQLARRAPGRFELKTEIHTAMIVLGGLSLWLFVSRWMAQESSGFYLTSWAALALLFFVAGLGLLERMYRWLGLAVLGCALGRVVVFDVWKLEPGYRIASFFALGVVLLLLGFIYNKYQEKIKQWL